ncbi:hypothetical protein [Nocardioides sp. InS609-2]|uniref:hypothetical protein n=1 Tax=Nocardioides sp. InS609-2 TaxID=2760705 RepID=UPI0017B93AF7|nr:hypothetical protein [Nocardioides sp. InS609-2]MBA3781764.1 hypothetical protein [Nocardioides sp.]
MTRMVLGLIAILVLSSCSPGDSDSAEPAADDAKTFKAEMDQFASALLPELQAALGDAELKGMQAKFYEPGGNFGQWSYEAGGEFIEPPGTAEDVLDSVEEVLAQQGMEIERPAGSQDISAMKGNIGVLVQRALEADVETVSGLNVRISSIDRLKSGDDFAEDAEPEDYLAYLK